MIWNYWSQHSLWTLLWAGVRVFIRFICCESVQKQQWECLFIQNISHLPQLSTIPCSCCRTLTPPPSRGAAVPSDRYIIVRRLFKCPKNSSTLHPHYRVCMSKTQTWWRESWVIAWVCSCPVQCVCVHYILYTWCVCGLRDITKSDTLQIKLIM